MLAVFIERPLVGIKRLKKVLLPTERTSIALARPIVSKGLPHQLGPIPLHDEITFLSLPRRRIVLIGDRATLIASVHTQDECPELFGVRLGAEKDGLCGVSGKRPSPGVARTDVDRN
jgi:hypothetical protein